MNPATTPDHRAQHIGLLLVGLAVLAWSAWKPKDYFIWFLECAPAMIYAAIAIALYRRFRFTDLVYWLVLIHAIILIVGGHYTYAEMPLFNWLRDEFGLARNYYDRLGHVAQGFIPAIIAREVLVRLNVVNGKAWLFFVVVCFCLALSAFYEFVEWWVAVGTGEAATAFLATQGDVWDTQWDMFLALIGATAAQLLLRGWHDRQLRRLKASGG
jgi:putative membrane protein